MKEYFGTIVVVLILLIITILIIGKLIKDKKQGKRSCGCNCSGCHNSCLEHKKK